MMNEKIYQIIYNELLRFLPSDWEKLVVYLEHGEASYSYSFYVKVKGKYQKCFDIAGISEEKLFETFEKIESFVTKERKKEKNPWTNMTMLVDRDGSFKADFDYTDLSAGTYQYKKQWKEKYLS